MYSLVFPCPVSAALSRGKAQDNFSRYTAYMKVRKRNILFLNDNIFRLLVLKQAKADCFSLKFACII